MAPQDTEDKEMLGEKIWEGEISVRVLLLDLFLSSGTIHWDRVS